MLVVLLNPGIGSREEDVQEVGDKLEAGKRQEIWGSSNHPLEFLRYHVLNIEAVLCFTVKLTKIWLSEHG